MWLWQILVSKKVFGIADINTGTLAEVLLISTSIGMWGEHP